MENLKLNTNKAILFLLEQKYQSEFKVVEGLNRHPDFINFYQWLEERKLIDKNELERITSLLNSQETDVWELCDMAKGNISLTIDQKAILIKETQSFEGCEKVEYYERLSAKQVANDLLSLSYDYAMGQLP